MSFEKALFVTKGMKIGNRFLICLCILQLLCSSGCYAQKLPKLNIDPSSWTVSGISGGGAMATQVIVAFSSKFAGAGIIAGPPYWCAQDNVDIALTSCETKYELISVDELIGAADYAYEMDSIDSTSNLKNKNIFLVSGSKDTVVVTGVVQKSQSFFKHYGSNVNLKIIQGAEHAWYTTSYGNDCGFLGTPYINNCGYEFTGDMLGQLYGSVYNPINSSASNLITFSQKLYTPLDVDPADISLDAHGFAYIPSNCTNGTITCKLHLVLHGCNQNYQTIGDVLITKVGLNEYAESNNIVILYPQTISTTLNPQSCFDWWAYTGTDYATQLGPQMIFIKNIMQAVNAGSF